jgi:8-oxo-dGTP pyrophosphatase MutT (NUDIX family)
VAVPVKLPASKKSWISRATTKQQRCFDDSQKGPGTGPFYFGYAALCMSENAIPIDKIRITDPQAARIVSVGSDLPAVPPAHLTEPALRQRFANPPAWEPETRGDGGLFPGRTPREAAVLVPLVLRASGITVLLTQRTSHLHDHAGQISFPGGRRDPQDASLHATALRETAEETGISAAHIQVVGELPLYQTVTGYHVTPVLSFVQPGFDLLLDAFEVAAAFEVPLAFLMNPANHQRRAFATPIGERQFTAMPYDDAGAQRFIWGATAGMIRNLYRLLSA